MAEDQLGLPLAGSEQAARAYDRAVADYWGLTGDPVGALKPALAADPSFVLARRGDRRAVPDRRLSRRPCRGRRRDRRGGARASPRLAPREAACRRRQGVGRRPVDRRHARLGGDPHGLADRRPRAALRPGRILLPRPIAGDPRLDRPRVAGMGARPSARELPSRRLCVRTRRGGRTRARRGGCAGGAGAQPEGCLGDARARPCARDGVPDGGRDRLSQRHARGLGGGAFHGGPRMVGTSRSTSSNRAGRPRSSPTTIVSAAPKLAEI